MKVTQRDVESSVKLENIQMYKKYKQEASTFVISYSS